MTRIEKFLAVALIATAIITAARQARGDYQYCGRPPCDTPTETPTPRDTPDPQDCLHGEHAGDPHCFTPTPTETPTPTATPTTCLFHCDCNGDNVVSIGEVIQAVNSFLGEQPVCFDAFDANHDERVSIGEVVQCVNNFLGVCP